MTPIERVLRIPKKYITVKAKHFETDRDIAVELDFQFLFYRMGHQQSETEVDDMAYYYSLVLKWLSQ